MLIRYKLTEADFVEANRANSGWMASVTPVVGYVMLLAGTINLATSWGKRSVLPTLVFFVLGGYFAFGVRWTVKNAFRKSARLHRDFTAEIDEAGVQVSAEASATRNSWSDIVRCRESKNLFLVYVGPNAFQPLPKRAFSAAEVEQFRAIAAQHLPPPKSGSRAMSVRTLVFVVVILASLMLLLQVIRTAK